MPVDDIRRQKLKAPADNKRITLYVDCNPCRVIVLAYKQLPGEAGPAELRHMPRAEAESGLTFAGFAVLACPLKPGSDLLLFLPLNSVTEPNHPVPAVASTNFLRRSRTTCLTAVS
jgi:hypothetical protein